MTNEEARRVNRAAELQKLRDTVEEFSAVVDEARRLAVECEEWAKRMRIAQREADIDKLIDNLDRLTRRGKYAPRGAPVLRAVKVRKAPRA